MGKPHAFSICAAGSFELQLLADGELDDAMAADVRGHVAGCGDCQHAWRLLLGTRRLISQPIAMPASLSTALAAIVDA
jgi:hypothetical protein